MNSQNALLGVAAIVLIVAALSMGFTYYSIASFKQGLLTGNAVANGTIYINITSSAAINFTNSIINWSNGTLTSGASYALLSTSGPNYVVNGTWVPVTNGFTIDNIGNVNLSINIRSGKTNASFIGGTGPIYKYNVTNIETGSCVASPGFTLGQFYDVNTTGVGTPVCGNLSYVDTRDSIRIDIMLGIPYDAPATSSLLTDQIQVTASQSAT